MKYFLLLQKKSNFISSRKQPHVPPDYNFQSPIDVQVSNNMFKQKRDYKANGEMGKCKTKPFRQIQIYSHIFRHIQTYLDIFRHDQAYLGIIQAYSEPCVTLTYSEPQYIQNSGTFRIRYVQNPGLFRTLGNLVGEAYSEP